MFNILWSVLYLYLWVGGCGGKEGVGAKKDWTEMELEF